MIITDRLPATPGASWWISSFLAFLVVMFNCKYNITRGEMPFTAEKLFTLFLKKEEKNLNLEFIFGIGANEVRQMDREGEAQKNTVVLFHVLLFLHKSGEHSAETLNINIYLLMQ